MLILMGRMGLQPILPINNLHNVITFVTGRLSVSVRVNNASVGDKLMVRYVYLDSFVDTHLVNGERLPVTCTLILCNHSSCWILFHVYFSKIPLRVAYLCWITSGLVGTYNHDCGERYAFHLCNNCTTICDPKIPPEQNKRDVSQIRDEGDLLRCKQFVYPRRGGGSGSIFRMKPSFIAGDGGGLGAPGKRNKWRRLSCILGGHRLIFPWELHILVVLQKENIL